jgi:broad-specificity NMP kinase
MNRKPFIIELVGPPGAGKTRLANTILAKNSQFVVENPPYFRKPQYIPFFITNILFLSPNLVRFYHNKEDGWLTSRDIALMTILRGWHILLKRSVKRDNIIVVLDEGAVCLMYKLLFSGSDLLNSESARAWWDETYEKWANTLDLVVRLESPPETLVERVRARNTFHEINELTDSDAIQWFKGVQDTEDKVISNLRGRNKTLMLADFNTSDSSPDQIFEELWGLISET